MTVTVRRVGQSVLNESLPVAIITAAELAVYDITILTRWWRGQHATMGGVAVPANDFTWKDRKLIDPLTPAVSGVEPSPIVASTKQFLRFGYGDALTDGANGSLQSADGVSVFTGTSVSMAVVCRTPTVATAAAAGGYIAGSKVVHTSTNDGTNTRAVGFTLGFGSTSLGKPRWMSLGDSTVASPSGTVDHRDGAWHLYVGIFDFAAQTNTIRVDGGANNTTSTQITTPRSLSVTTGVRQIRVGASGAVAQVTPDYTYVGDIGEVLVFDGVLAGADLTAVETCLKTLYSIA